MINLDALCQLCLKVEGLAHGSIAGVTISDSDFNRIEHAIFPALPSSFSAAITGVPLEPVDFGSCVKAISVGEPITCPDIENDRVFDPRWRQVCLEHGLKAIQSRPIFLNGRPRGTFVLAFREPKPETDWNVALMTFAADAASQALSEGTLIQPAIALPARAFPKADSPTSVTADLRTSVISRNFRPRR
jgi:GAF domain-containing protein